MSIKSILKACLAKIQEKQYIPIPKSVNTDKMLNGKTIMITGGSGGIGFSMAQLFIIHGAKVIITGTQIDKLKKCCNELGEENARYIILDFCNHNEMSRLIDNAEMLFGCDRIDALVNAAGVTVHTDFFNIEENEYNRVMDINVKGMFFMCQAIGKYMIKKKIHGNILNISSSSALRPAWTPYQISKWAVRGFTQGLADILLPYGIVVNAIAPGPTATQMMGKQNSNNIYLANNPSKRYAMPCEIASLAVYMLSDYGRLIVGDTVYISGGSGTISYHN